MTEYKAFVPSEFKSATRGSAQFVIGTTGVIDSDGDVVMAGAIGTQVATVLPAHRWDALPLGKARISEQDDHIFADVQFNPTPDAQAWYEAIKWDFENPPAVQQYSWGYEPTRSRPGDFNGRKARFLQSLTIYEVSPVVIGASVGTHTAMVKQMAGLSAAERAVLDAARTELARHDADLMAAVRAIAEPFLAAEKARHYDALVTEICIANDQDFQLVDRQAVPAATARAGEAAAALAAKQLGIVGPAVKWFTQQTPTLDGRSAPPGGIVYLNARLTPARAVSVAAHEVFHLLGHDESACVAYESRFLRELTA